MAHDTEHEELLQQMLAGDLLPDASRSRALLEGCAECAQRWRELQDLVASIDSADRERREVLAEAARIRRVPGSDRVAATLEEERRKTFAASSRGSWFNSPWRIAIAAAALLLVGFFVARVLFPGKPEPADKYLGPTAIAFRSDYHTLSPDTVIRWNYVSGSDKGPFLLRLHGTLEGRPYSKEIQVPSAEWMPTRELLNEMPSPVGLRIVAIDTYKAEIGSSPEISLTVSR